MDNNQKDSFLSYEANAWFERNFEVISNYNPDDDREIKGIADPNLINEYY